MYGTARIFFFFLKLYNAYLNPYIWAEEKDEYLVFFH